MPTAPKGDDESQDTKPAPKAQPKGDGGQALTGSKLDRIAAHPLTDPTPDLRDGGRRHG